MGEITLGVVVRIRPSRKQMELFHKNFGCVRKVYNETLGKYNKLHQVNNDINPSLSLLNSLMMESKKELFYLMDVESTSLQQSIRDLYAAFSNFFKNPRDFNRPKFHRKKDKKFSFRQTIPSNKMIIKGKYLSLRKYGEVKIQTSRKYYELLNNPDVKFNNITITYDGINYYAVINITTFERDKFELTNNMIGCDINSNRNGWLVTSDGVKEFFDVDYENKMIRHINRLMSKCRKLSRKWKTLKKDYKSGITKEQIN